MNDFYDFEDIKQIYVNRYRECKGKVLAKDLGEFTAKIIDVIADALNTTTVGQQLVDDLREAELKKNPGMTEEDWSNAKARLMTFLFHLIMTECPLMKHEYALHTYEALRKENVT